ncbi:protein FAM47E [Patella vulgata]|uniref:protein FAM47E n=1 Tax=Patella vulgata TaxID=6465 RepID=UPI00217F760E|nr:protein FAM47E [Patella vulgata]
MSLAEKKYDLALFNTLTDKKIRNHPWYKERLRTKYIKSLSPGETSKCLIAKDWMFLKDGLDDYRDGLPPPANGEEVFIKGNKGPSPCIIGSSESIEPVKRPVVKNRFDKYQVCFSRITPQQQQKREHIEEIEYGLLQHPLALYPHLEESVPTELFEDVVDILDPEMNIESDEEDSIKGDLGKERDGDTRTKSTEPPSSVRNDADEEDGMRNPYRWLPRKEEKKDNKKKNERRPSSPSQEEHINRVTKDFCKWVADLGGESNNIEESTITSLFASGYETKPALSVPIHVVELTNVPPELRMSAPVPAQVQITKNLPAEEEKQKPWKYSGAYEPSWAKFRYGSWYLQPKTWKKRDWEDPLMDPKELKNQEMSEAKKKSQDLNEDLSTMHGAQAFMDFINRKGTRKIEFLEQVSEIQLRQKADEQRRVEAEILSKNKRHHVRK